MKRPEREVDHSLPYSAISEISGVLPLPSSPLCFRGVDKEKFYLYLLTLTLRPFRWAVLPNSNLLLYFYIHVFVGRIVLVFNEIL